MRAAANVRQPHQPTSCSKSDCRPPPSMTMTMTPCPVAICASWPPSHARPHSQPPPQPPPRQWRPGGAAGPKLRVHSASRCASVHAQAQFSAIWFGTVRYSRCRRAEAQARAAWTLSAGAHASERARCVCVQVRVSRRWHQRCRGLHATRAPAETVRAAAL
jgi:hypothetical protein